MEDIEIVLTLEFWPGHGFRQPSYRIFATPAVSYDPSACYGDKPEWNPSVLSAYIGTVNSENSGKSLVGFLHDFEDRLHRKGMTTRHHCHNMSAEGKFGDYLVEEPGDDSCRADLDNVPPGRTGIVYDWSKLPGQFADTEAAKSDMGKLENLFPAVAEELGLRLYSLD